MRIDRSGLYPIVIFDSKEEEEAYFRGFSDMGFNSLYTGPTISIEEVKRRRFGKEDE